MKAFNNETGAIVSTASTAMTSPQQRLELKTEIRPN